MADPTRVTVLLDAYARGDRQAFDQLVPLVYDELRRIARYHLRRADRGQTLDTVGLVNEAYMKLVGSDSPKLENRSHLLAVAAHAMRQVIITRARARAAAKRGGGAAPVELDENRVGGRSEAEWLIDLDRAIERLRANDDRMARVFECRFFGGLSEEETAAAIGLSLRSVQRYWMKARAWIRAELLLDREA